MPAVFRTAFTARMFIEHDFPGLKKTRWLLKSPSDDTYKCTAWAACRTDILWWPVEGPRIYWPPGVPLNDTVEAFVQSFAGLGYIPTPDSDFQFGYQKVAIYASDEDRLLHIARQRFWGGGWLSKLGAMEDIAHADLHCLEGDPSAIPVALGRSYGRVTRILKRSWWEAIINLCLFRCLRATIKFWFYRMRHPSWILDNLSRDAVRCVK